MPEDVAERTTTKTDAPPRYIYHLLVADDLDMSCVVHVPTLCGKWGAWTDQDCDRADNYQLTGRARCCKRCTAASEKLLG